MNLWMGGWQLLKGDKMCEKLVEKIDSEIDEFFAELCEKYGIYVNLNDLEWDFN